MSVTGANYGKFWHIFNKCKISLIKNIQTYVSFPLFQRLITQTKHQPMEKDFIQLINTNRGLIYKVCHLYCRDDDDKKDLFQEIVLQLWTSYPHFRKESRGSTWLYRVALNTAISNFRKESRKPEGKSISASELQIPDMNLRQDENDTTGLLQQAIGKLSEIEKAIIMLYLDDKSYDEIAEIIGITHSNVGVRINRIKIKLEKLIQSDSI
jgi:RNA polymerase sigma-70 factor (ECF subfamily)